MSARGDNDPGRLSKYVVKDPERFLSVVEHVLSLDYLEPGLRKRVLRLQAQLVNAARAMHQDNGDGTGV